MTNGAHPAGGFTEPEWAAAIPWGAYLDGIEKKRDLWEANARRVRLAPEAIARLEHLPGRRRVLVLTADWCGDAARIVPVLGRAFEAASDVEARFLDTDAHPAVLSRNLTHGGRSIPLAIVQDESGRELGTWGPRPAPLQALMRARRRELGPPSGDGKAAWYQPILAWYGRDGGRTIVEEVLMLLERGGAPR